MLIDMLIDSADSGMTATRDLDLPEHLTMLGRLQNMFRRVGVRSSKRANT
jgi:hypothetical protein